MDNQTKEEILNLMSEVANKIKVMEKITQDQISFLIQSLQELGESGERALARYDEYRKKYNLK